MKDDQVELAVPFDPKDLCGILQLDLAKVSATLVFQLRLTIF